MNNYIISAIKNFLLQKLNAMNYETAFKEKVTTDIDSAICDLSSLKDIELFDKYRMNKIYDLLKLAISYVNKIDVSRHNSYLYYLFISMTYQGFKYLIRNNNAIDIITSWANKHHETETLVMDLISDCLNPIDKIIDNRNITQLNLEEIPRDILNHIVEIKEKPKGLCLYHGTSYDNYQQIVNDGYIRKAAYKDIEFNSYIRPCLKK